MTADRRKVARTSTRSALARSAAASLALPLSALITSPVLAQSLGADGRGALAAVVTPLFLAVPLFAGGVFEATSFSVASKTRSVRSALFSALALGLVYGAGGAAAVWVTAPWLVGEHGAGLIVLRVLGLTLPLTYVQQAVRGIAQGAGLFDETARERLLGSLLRLVLIVVLALAGTLTPSLAAAVTWLAPTVVLLTVVPSVVRVLKAEPRSSTGSRAEDSTRRHSLFLFGWRVWPGTLAGALLLRLDQLYLVQTVPLAEVGRYAIAVGIAEVPFMAIAACRDVLLARSAGGNVDLAAKLTRVVFAGSLLVVLVGAAAAPLVIPPVFGEDFDGAIALTQALLLSVPFSAVSLLMSGALNGLGRPLSQTTSQLLALGVGVVVLVLLVPSLGAMGAAVSTVGSYASSAALAVWLYTRATGRRLAELLVPRREDFRLVGLLGRGRSRT